MLSRCFQDAHLGQRIDVTELLHNNFFMWYGRKVFDFISSWDRCQRSSPLRIYDMPQAGLEPIQNLSSGLGEWNFVVVITTTPWGHKINIIYMKPGLQMKYAPHLNNLYYNFYASGRVQLPQVFFLR